DRVFRHFYFRDIANELADKGDDAVAAFLSEDDTWTASYFEAGHQKTNRRLMFFAQPASTWFANAAAAAAPAQKKPAAKPVQAAAGKKGAPKKAQKKKEAKKKAAPKKKGPKKKAVPTKSVKATAKKPKGTAGQRAGAGKKRARRTR